MSTQPYAEEPALPEPTPAPEGGLVQLGAADAVVCEDGVCAVPPAKE